MRAFIFTLLATTLGACASTPPPPPTLTCPAAPVPLARVGYPLTYAGSAIASGSPTPGALDGIARPALLLSREQALQPWLGTTVRIAVPCPPGDDGTCRGYQEQLLTVDLLRDERRVLLFEPRVLGRYDVRLVEVFNNAAREWCLPAAVDRVTGEAVTPTVNAVFVQVPDDTWGLAAAPTNKPRERERDEGEWDRCEGMSGHQRAVCECMRTAKSPSDCRMP